MQNFKGDDQELKMISSASPALEGTSDSLTEFYNDSYETEDLGALIWDSGRSPLSNAIKRETFITSFKQLFESFTQAGTFEAYITVFKKIFGDDVDLTFTVPGPGHLQIGIIAAELEESQFVARKIVDNAYVFENIITEDLDNIVFQTVKGFQSQYELEKMLFEMVPGGVFTEISLTFGG